MPKQAKSSSAAARRARFTPVAVRARHDGWSPERQLAFIDALAESGCVAEACASVGMSRKAAYALRTRVDAQAFRVAWDAALDFAIRRLSDECLSRALNGVAVPHYYKGEQVGEHRRYDTRLALFLLRYRDPLRYAATLDKMVYSGHPEAAALGFARARDRAAEEAHGVADQPGEPLPSPYAALTMDRALAEQKEEMRRQAEQHMREQHLADDAALEKFRAVLRACDAERQGEGTPTPDVVSPSSPSADATPPPSWRRRPEPRIHPMRD